MKAFVGGWVVCVCPASLVCVWFVCGQLAFGALRWDMEACVCVCVVCVCSASL